VPIARGEDGAFLLGEAADVLVEYGDDLIAFADGEGAAGAEVVLDIDQQKSGMGHERASVGARTGPRVTRRKKDLQTGPLPGD
jgi:hypothetical protein